MKGPWSAFGLRHWQIPRFFSQLSFSSHCSKSKTRKWFLWPFDLFLKSVQTAGPWSDFSTLYIISLKCFKQLSCSIRPEQFVIWTVVTDVLPSFARFGTSAANWYFCFSIIHLMMIVSGPPWLTIRMWEQRASFDWLMISLYTSRTRSSTSWSLSPPWSMMHCSSLTPSNLALVLIAETGWPFSLPKSCSRSLLSNMIGVCLWCCAMPSVVWDTALSINWFRRSYVMMKMTDLFTPGQVATVYCIERFLGQALPNKLSLLLSQVIQLGVCDLH